MWWFTSPKIIYGEDALDKLEDLDGERAFVVSDETMQTLGYLERVTGHLERAGMETAAFTAIEPDPSLASIEAGAAACCEFEPDVIVGLGGGSAMDAGKAIWIRYERPDLPLEYVNPFDRLGLREKARFVTIPTTAGTGAEVTWATVVTDREEQRKFAPASRELVADVAIVDPSVTTALPPKLTAGTGVDALTHAVEAYTSTWKNEFSDALARYCVPLIFRYLPRAVADGTDEVARTKMHIAATMGGLAFGNAQVGIAHSLGHALGVMLHIHHGLAVGMALPYVIEFNREVDGERYGKLVSELRLVLGDDAPASLTTTEKEAGATQLSAAVRELLSIVELPTSLKALGIAKDDLDANLDALVTHAANDNCTVTASRAPTNEELAKLLRAMYDGKRVDF